MGVAFSGKLATCSAIENGLESFIVDSISIENDGTSTPASSISIKPRSLEQMFSTKCISLDKEDIHSPRLDGSEGTIQQFPEHEAATKLQKVYKSFRTRRKLADCAVLIEQSCWKLLDYVELKHSSISFFDEEKHETAISRWSRARTRAAKVGKGLSKNGKARKLALRHWLEAIDPRHRYGHNLHFYYKNWFNSQSKEPFFYWLDIGEGKEVNLTEKCPRSKLQHQCIKYLGPMERIAYEVIVEDGKFLYKQSGELLNTTDDAKWIFVLSTSKTLYVGQKKKGSFQHSSFLAGGATVAAGRLVVENGVLKAVWPHSGHYKPTEENFKDFISFLEENNVDLTDVQMTAVDEEESQGSSKHMRMSSSVEDLVGISNIIEPEVINVKDLAREEPDSAEAESSTDLEHSKFRNLSRNLTNLEIPKRDDLIETLQTESSDLGANLIDDSMDSLIEDAPTTSEEAKSYQLGKQLSCRWTSGAGPRIGCVREYPSKLQVHALEQVSLSPRSAALSKSYITRSGSCLSPKVSSPSHCGQEMTANFGFPYRTQSSPFMKEGFLGTVARVS